MSVIYDSRHRMPQKDLEYWVHEYASNSQFRESVNSAAQGVGRAVGYLYGKAASIGKQAASRIKAAAGFSGSKRQRADVKTEQAADPLNHDKFKVSRMPPIGGSTVFAGGETVERPLSLSCGSSIDLNVLKSFLQDFIGSKRYKCQFVVQYVGEDQTRSCQGMLFRHRVPGTVSLVANRVLKPTASYFPPIMNGASGAGTQITGLPYNFFDIAYGGNMKCMISPLGMGNIEDICAGLTPPCAASEYAEWSSTGTRNTGADVGLISVPTYTEGVLPAQSATWVGNYVTASNPGASMFRSPRITVGCRQGGVKLFFENKHPVGSFVEVIQYKLRDNHTKSTNFYPSFASGQDSVMADLQYNLGGVYLDSKMQNRVTDAQLGRSPLISDVTTSPYFPLLPKSSNTAYGNNAFSERKRIRFALASGAKRMVNVKFGGFKYDPLTLNNYTNDSSEVILLVIAVNGQMISAFAQQGTDQLITGDVAAGHNMFIRGEYYEDLYPLKVTRAKSLYTGGEMQPRIPTVDTVGVTLSAYQILDARTQQRGNNITMEAGAVIDNTDGDGVDDDIKY